MTDEEAKSKIKETLHSIFPSPEVAARVVDLVVSERPLGWSRKSVAPYFNKRHGAFMQKQIDQMITTGQDIIFRFNVWCTDSSGISKSTLYNLVNQSIRYVIEKLDTPEKKYANWYELVRVHRNEKDIATTIRWIPGLNPVKNTSGELGEMTPEFVESAAGQPIWRQELEEWLESEGLEPFHKTGLVLGADDIAYLREKIGQLKTVISSIKSHEIKLVKVNS